MNCKACDCKLTGETEQNAYGDAFCSVCWEIKQKNPMKTNDEIAELKPYHHSESNELNIKLINRIIAILLLVGLILSLIKK